MYLSQWMRRWLAAALICIVIIAGSGILLLADAFRSKAEPLPAYVINQARIQVSGMMRYLEQYSEELEHASDRQEVLLAMSEMSGASLIVAGADGRVLFHTQRSSIETIDVRTAVHYDIYASQSNKEVYQIAFPIVAERSGIQVGNAIFELPVASVRNGSASTHPTAPYAALLLSTGALLVLLYLLHRKITYAALQPIGQLKDYSEAILKGDYEQKAEHGSMDEIGELYAMFDQMRLELMKLNLTRTQQEQAQKELISSISHDIRTPLTTVKAYIEAIRAGVCTSMEAVMDYMEVMQLNADQMARLMDDLLLHALRELGQISVHPIEQYSKPIFHSMIAPLGHYIRTTGVTFIEPSSIPNVLIKADSTRLEQVVANLVSNALKHTTAGDSIQISIEQDSKQLIVTIADTGQGILPQDMPFVFERYFRGHADESAAAPGSEGTGLGLSICKSIIEAHQGTISFTSQKGQGTVFYFTIPLC